MKVLSKLYDNPVAAEVPGLLVQASSDTTTDAVGKIIDNVQYTVMVCYAEESQLLDIGVVVNTASTESHLQSLSAAFSSLMLSSYDVTVPPDFLLLSAQVMRHLQSCERSNVVYGLAKGLGEI